MEEGLTGVWKDLRGEWRKDLRGVWRIDLGCFVVLGDYEKSPLNDLRGVWRKDLSEYGRTLGENGGRTLGEYGGYA